MRDRAKEKKCLNCGKKRVVDEEGYCRKCNEEDNDDDYMQAVGDVEADNIDRAAHNALWKPSDD